jgi:hypothetical protein
MELSEKINTIDRELLQRMIGTKDIPIHVLTEYFRVKKLVDKIDARINPSQLAEIVLRCGFDTENMNFNAPAPDLQPVAPPSMPVGPGQFVVGENVQFLVDEQIVCGKIVCCQPISSDGKRLYTIEGENDESYDIEESDLEVM